MDDALTCIICGTAMIVMPTKATCPNCGYQEDGTDLFPPDPPTRHPTLTFNTPTAEFEDTLFPLGPVLPQPERPHRRRSMRPRRPLPPTDWLFNNN